MHADAEKVRSLFLAAVENHAPGQWAAYLDEACAGDQALRRRVEVLLRAHQQSNSLLDAPVPKPVATVEELVGERPGTVIGSYKLLEQIGEGGFGVVFMAEQQQPLRRKVALKLIKPGMDTRQVIARFEAERQALALMDHPNIAHVFDGGEAASGRPYFVMELVKGVPITDFCDQNHLPVRERLELFVDVCQAVQHAHQKGIIHRDLKPTNVLVTMHDATPVVKVIDFGVAKAVGQQLTDKTLFTGFAQMVGTPLYMSPEQAGQSGLDADTRSDIYSLGVLLYELLTGTTPFDRERLRAAGYDELRRIIREEEPPRPSTRMSTLGQASATVSANRQSEPHKLSQLFRGELDWIVMKALEKDRNRRYETASAFAADVQRYLQDEPVLACPPSAWYLFRKFARRNKAVLAVAGLVLFFLVLLGGGVGWVARDRATRRLMIDEAVTRLLQQADEFQEKGNWPDARMVVERAEAALTGAGASAALEQRVRERLANLVMVQQLEEIRLRRSQNLDYELDNEAADREYATRFRDYGIDVEKLAPAEAAEAIRSRTGVTVALTVALDDWAYVRRGRGDTVGAAALTEVALAADPDPFRRRLREAVARREWNSLGRLAASADLLRQPPTSLVLLGLSLRKVDRSLQVLRMAQQEYPGDFWINYTLGSALFADQIDRREAVFFLRCAVAIRPQSCAAHCNLGSVLEANGHRDEAIACYRQAVKHQPDNVWPHVQLGNALSRAGQPGEAVASYHRALALKPDGAAAHRGLAWLRASCPDPRFRDLTEAVALATRAVELAPLDGNAWNTLGAVRYRAGAWQGAVMALEKTQALRKSGDSFTWFFLALAQVQLGRKKEARACYDRGVAWMERNQPNNEELRQFRGEAAELLGIKTDR